MSNDLKAAGATQASSLGWPDVVLFVMGALSAVGAAIQGYWDILAITALGLFTVWLAVILADRGYIKVPLALLLIGATTAVGFALHAVLLLVLYTYLFAVSH